MRLRVGMYKGVLVSGAVVVPYLAVSFSVYDHLRAQLPEDRASRAAWWHAPAKVGMGATAGVVAQVRGCSRDFALLQRRMSVPAAGTLLSPHAPEVWAGSDVRRHQLLRLDGEIPARDRSALTGAWEQEVFTGSYSVRTQALAYPADTVRRRIQLSGSVGQRTAYRGYWDCVRRMAREEGALSFYRGLGVNCLKVAPAAALQFVCYDLFRSGITLYAAVVAARNG